ncbi:MAG: phosphodiester glycosidase family protein [Bacteroidetes bacterium]|nr:phosphodiester glycosidase family protein [Bacteroidota bacterium]
MLKYLIAISLLICTISSPAQQNWTRVDSLFEPLPTSIEVWRTSSPVEGKPSIVYLVRAKLASPELQFKADTSYRRRLTPRQFFEKNQAPLLVVNASFFSFTSHQNFNLLIQNGVLWALNVHAISGKGKDSLSWKHPLGSAIGITKKRRADVAWTFTDSSLSIPLAVQMPVMPLKDSHSHFSRKTFKKMLQPFNKPSPWRMNTAVGGGPVLVQHGLVAITNEEEMKFAGPALEDRHPRTAMGYTKEGWLLILVAEGRHPGIAEGITLKQTAQLLIDWNCEEGLNLDGGGSSTLLINGKPTITPSDKSGERAVPGVFIIKRN